MYEPEQLKEKTMPKAGTQIAATVSKIEEGTLKEFVPEDKLQKFENSSPEDRVLRVTAQSGEAGEIERNVLIMLPKDNEVHPKSKMAQWKKKYGDYPKEGQEVYLIADADGYYQFNV